MVNIKHPFCLNLEYAFESKNYIGFVMEYCPGGELFYHLRNVKSIFFIFLQKYSIKNLFFYIGMTEDEARFYIVQIFIGIKYIH